ncbi:MAG: hypothetical protein QNI99_14795 [Woeseiaceae bacterium]|nr:hypothetical protein [Woeseiaceae bacterium]
MNDRREKVGVSIAEVLIALGVVAFFVGYIFAQTRWPDETWFRVASAILFLIAIPSFAFYGVRLVMRNRRGNE